MSILDDLLMRFRLSLILSFNIILTVISLFLALCLRFDFDLLEITDNYLILPLGLLIISRQITYYYFSLNEGYWRYSSMSDLKGIIKAHFISSAFFAAGIWVVQLSFPRSVIFGEFVLSVFFSGGSRFLVRSLSEYLVGKSRMKNALGIKEAVILGAGDSGHLLIKLLQTSPHIPYLPTVVLDDLERLKGSNVYGVRIEGPISDLKKILLKNSEILAVLVAIPSLLGARLEEIRGICEEAGVTFKKLQSFEDIACLDANEETETVSIESILQKETKIEHENEILQALKGKRILVTGAGGSIGSEMVRQIISFNPERLILLDNSEYNLFRMVNELRAEKITAEFVIANICDRKRIAKLFEDYRPQFVFHAAAYKHVPLMEDNCYEAFQNNVVGTRIILEQSILHKTERFVFISTDKAVDPCSIMGCSKKIAEMLIQHLAANNPAINTAVVRFGNVINSAGSVIPLFKEQIANGGPLTVTHPDMERFFMSITEAVKLVLTAGTLGERGQIYVLDMGKKLKIVDVAKKMLMLYGRRDIQIEFTGLRPGEKMTEDLLSAYEDITKTNIRKVSRLSTKLKVSEDILPWIDLMTDRLGTVNDVEIGEMMKAFVGLMETEVTGLRRAL